MAGRRGGSARAQAPPRSTPRTQPSMPSRLALFAGKSSDCGFYLRKILVVIMT
jgi:hypothetical protein